MQKSRTGLIVGVGFLLFLLGVYLWGSYSSIFVRQVGYIYHPGTDRIYKLDMAPSLSRFKQWEPFIPFHSLNYGEPKGGEYLGKLQTVLSEIEAERRLMREDSNAWIEKQNKEAKSYMKEVNAGDFELWDIDFYWRRDIEPKELLPKSIPGLAEYLDDKPAGLSVVDAVVSKWTLKGKRPELEILEGALLTRGRAAHKLLKLTGLYQP